MRESRNIELVPVSLEELPQFIQDMQQAFSVAVREKFGVIDPIPSDKEVESSFHSPGTDTCHIVADGRRVGGAVITIHGETQRNSLDLFFISPEHHSHGLGLAAWKAIEAKYPATAVWETITPYFEERNIHFYINKCGFRIVEFFNDHHVDPAMPRPETESGEPVLGTDAYFRFEKVMK